MARDVSFSFPCKPLLFCTVTLYSINSIASVCSVTIHVIYKVNFNELSNSIPHSELVVWSGSSLLQLFPSS